MKKRYLILPLAAAWFVVFTRARQHGKFTLFDDINKAIDSIAHGNFNVRIDGGDHHPLSELTERLNKMARELGSLESMRADFVSNVSHEIQSPLTSIGGFAKLLRESANDEQARHYADVIIAESKRLSSLSDNLLKLSTLDNNKIPLNRTDFRLDKQLQQVALTLEPQWSAKNIELSCELAPTTVNADSELLTQVWLNLLNNAIKFTPENGAIQLTIDNGLLTIADTGCGISDEDRLHIFERFYKVDKARDRSLGGSGLGLSIVKKILDLHGYSIAVESEIGKGTRFVVKL
ncbi:MAG: HAMP domain-containing histidine kinase [Oscillospiraceae bacterium]|nr:HAMP domain-containing histidine kinase [Oscillospiraceae bacterium]